MSVSFQSSTLVYRTIKLDRLVTNKGIARSCKVQRTKAAPARCANTRTQSDTKKENISFELSRRNVFSSAGGIILASVISKVFEAPAEALGGEIELSDIRYEVVECKEGTYTPSRGGYVCATFTATAKNKFRKVVEAADVFGFVTDAYDNSALAVNPDGINRTVIAGILNPIPQGTSEVQFEVVLKKEALELGKLKFKGFKATTSADVVQDRFKPFDDCELDPTSCE